MFALLCAAVLVFSLAACGSKKDETTDPLADKSLTEVMDSILTDVTDLPMAANVDLDKDNFASYAFTPWADGYEGLASEAQIGSIAHSVVLIRVPEGTDAAAVAAEIEQNANPRKWICVEAEKTAVMHSGRTILLVMSFETTADAILDNFAKLTGETVPAGKLSDTAGEETSADGETTAEDEATKDDATEASSTQTAEDKPTAEKPAAQKPATQKPADKPAAEKPADKPATTPTEPAPDEPEESQDLGPVMDSLMAGVNDLPMVGSLALDSSNFKNYSFVDWADGYQGIVSEAMVNAVAHSVVLVEVPEGGDAAAVAKSMKDNANPRKWICVEAESVQAASRGRLAILVMSSQSIADQVIANFNAL